MRSDFDFFFLPVKRCRVKREGIGHDRAAVMQQENGMIVGKEQGRTPHGHFMRLAQQAGRLPARPGVHRCRLALSHAIDLSTR